MFTQQLSTLLGAGQPLDRALQILSGTAGQTRKGGAPSNDIKDAVRGGASLSSALEQPARRVLAAVREHGARRRGGRQPCTETLQRLADYLERSRAAQAARVINALVYPAILLAMVGLSLLFLLVYVVPQFSSDVPKPGCDNLPWFSTVVLASGGSCALLVDLILAACRCWPCCG
jgi:general secretion pathway protein F